MPATEGDWTPIHGGLFRGQAGTSVPARHQPSHRPLESGAFDDLLDRYAPRLAVKAATIQTSTVISDTGSAWTRLLAEGGLSATAIFQALLSSRMAAAISRRDNATILINCSFPDVVNGIIKGLGHEVLCGTGNVAILS